MIRRAPLKNFKLRETLNEDEQAKLMHMLSRSCRDILHGTAIPSYSEIYYNCDLLCRYGHSRPLHSAIYNEVTVWSSGQLAQEWRVNNKTDTVANILGLWGQFESRLRALLDAFAVLDRVYVKRESGGGSVGLQATVLSAFKTAVWEGERGRLWRVALSQLDQCRVSDVVIGDQQCVEIRQFCRLLERLDIFNNDESLQLLTERTVKYYNVFFNDAIRTAGNEQLPKIIYEKLQWELAFQRAAFPESAQSGLAITVKRCLIGDRLQVLCESVLPVAFEKGDTFVLSLIYQLCTINDNIGQLSVAVVELIKSKCGLLNTVSEIIKLKDSFELTIIHEGFNNDQHIITAVKEGLEAAINQRTVFMSEQIAKYLHKTLMTAVTDVDSTKQNIAKALPLFRLLQGKESFEVFYKQFLAERLLRKTTIGTDFEHFAIDAMREECGAAFTSRMEGMFRDCSNSRDTQSAFQKSAAYRGKSTTVAFTVSVITNGIWPSINDAANANMFIPKSVQDDHMLFEQYYQKFAKKRKLKWEPMLADCTVRVPFDGGLVDIDMPAFVASVLMQFDQSDCMLIRTCLVKSGLEPAWFEKAVSVLAENAILSISNDQIGFNKHAKYTTDKISIGLDTVRFSPPATFTHDDLSAIRQQDKEERAFRVDAAIVRHLKRLSQQDGGGGCQMGDLRREIGDEDLIEERVKMLIEREFVEQRDGLLVYLP